MPPRPSRRSHGTALWPELCWAGAAFACAAALFGCAGEGETSSPLPTPTPSFPAAEPCWEALETPIPCEATPLGPLDLPFDPPYAAADAALAVTEVMSDNATTLLDEDGDPSDWIELTNLSASPVDLGGWRLADGSGQPPWIFPTTLLRAGERRVIFASGKDRATSGAPLHTDFRLSSDGERLSLIRPDGLTVEWSAQLPDLEDDVSWGAGLPEGEVLIAAGDPAAWLVPEGPPPEGWEALGFDDASWRRGPTGLGLDVTVPGFALRRVGAAGALTTVTAAEDALADPASWRWSTAADVPVVNLRQGGEGDRYGDDLPFPGPADGRDDDSAAEIRALITFPTAGTWTFDVTSDDGFQLEVGGLKLVEAAGGLHQDVLGYLEIDEAPVELPLRLVHFDRSGGAAIELSAAPRLLHHWYADEFQLVGGPGSPLVARAEDLSADEGSYHPDIRTDLSRELAGADRMLLRMPFAPLEPDLLSGLTLIMRADAGFTAWIDGLQVASQEPQCPPPPRVAAGAARRFDVSAALPLLGRQGGVLAVEGITCGAGAQRALILPELRGEVAGEGAVFFTRPTPGEANGEGVLGFLPRPDLSPEGGLYEDALEVSAAAPGAALRWTTDGRIPTRAAQRRACPMRIQRPTAARVAAFRPGWAPSRARTATYVLPGEVRRQDGAGLPAAWHREATPDYAVDPRIACHADYAEELVQGLWDIPTVALTLEPDDLWDPARGIYANSELDGDLWERPATFEWFGAEGSIAVSAGLRIYGNSSRKPQVPKHSLRAVFKGKYGPRKLDWDIFPGGGVDEFDSLIFRAGYNNTWFIKYEVERGRAQYARDLWCRRTQLEMGQIAARGRHTHLYLNGQYWGLHVTTERPDANFFSSWLGGEPEEWDAINSAQATDGDMTAYWTMIALAEGGLEDPERYAAIQAYLDLDNLIDYFLVHFYGGTFDWDIGNWYAGRRRQEGAGFKFIVWDAERTLESVNRDQTHVDNDGRPSRVFQKLTENPDFRRLLSERVALHLGPGGMLSPQVAAARYEAIVGEIEGAIVAESARWGDVQRPDRPYSRDIEWQAERERLMTEFFPARTEVLRQQLEANGWLVSAEAR